VDHLHRDQALPKGKYPWVSDHRKSDSENVLSNGGKQIPADEVYFLSNDPIR
jgi:hypothetical protein